MCNLVHTYNTCLHSTCIYNHLCTVHNTVLSSLYSIIITRNRMIIFLNHHIRTYSTTFPCTLADFIQKSVHYLLTYSTTV